MKYNIKFDLAKSTSNLKPVRVRVSYNSQRVDIRLGYSIPETCWNAKMQQAKADKPKNRDLCSNVNSAIRDIVTKIDDLFKREEYLNNRIPTLDEIKMINSYKGNESGISFSEIFNRYIEYNKSNIATGSVRVYHNFMRNVNDFNSDLKINDISQNTLQEFCDFIIYTKNLQNTTCIVYLRCFKAILRFAKGQGLYDNDGLSYNIKLKKSEPIIIYLTKEELEKLFNFLPNLKGSDGECLRAFLFCCFTGLRFSDMQQLKWIDVNDDYIAFLSIKTNINLRIPLNKYSKFIIEKQKEFKNIGVFPRFDLLTFNLKLKEICKKAGIDTPVSKNYYKGNSRIEKVVPKYYKITSHCARKTFVVNSIALGIPLEVIMEFTGHKTFTALKHYLKVIEDVKEINMQKFNDLF